MSRLALLALIVLCVVCLSQGSKDVCYLPIVEGNCSNRMSLWAFNITSRRCVRFYYSGCGGNANRFKYRLKCVFSCFKYRF
ncbi:collagen alpha 3VI chain [Echinococcus multilocularis]|uniref:Collagen alpha 3VI chain n=1 Tax=Echinococcus multilocularis TaxID=6211 RepID=A0A068YFP6_ECHMU|nr:collagen alpha 3VI chain [Echinococcus multilocularis]